MKMLRIVRERDGTGVKMVEPADKKLRRLPIAAGAVVAGIGLLVLAGWSFGLETLKLILPGLATMKANTVLLALLMIVTIMGLVFWTGRILKRMDAEQRKTEAQLRESEARLRAVLENSPDPIFLKDSGSRLLLANPATFAVIGKPPEACLGKTDADFYDDADTGRAIMENDRRIMDSGRMEVVEEFVSTPTERRVYLSAKAPYHDSDRRVIGLVGVTRDITERKQAEEALRESEERFRSTMDEMLEGCQILGHDWRFIYINDAAERHNRRPKTEFIGKRYMDMWPDIESTRVFPLLRRCMEERTPDTMENEFAFPDGTVGWFELSIQPVREGIFILSMDITERKRAEMALSQNREDLDRAQTVGQIGSWRLDVLHNVLTWSDENHRIFGLPKGTHLTYETFLETIHPDDRQYVDSKWKASLSGEPYDIEHRIIADGELKWVREKAYLEFDDAGNLLGGFGITQDISAHKKAEEKIQASLREKETLLRELSHRTKNNLNVISSLISLQIGSLQDPRMADLFRDMQTRILTMSLIHEKLYQSSELSSINIRAYITDLADAILSGYHVEREKMTVRLDIENILFSIDDVTPCGLIINELMSNSLKYAFPERRSGEICITLHQFAGEEIHLLYRDNGVGFPYGFDWTKTKSLGLKLVQRLVTQQLRGTIEFRSESGPGFLIRFPRYHTQK